MATAASKLASRAVKSSFPPPGEALKSEYERGGVEARDCFAEKQAAPALPSLPRDRRTRAASIAAQGRRAAGAARAATRATDRPRDGCRFSLDRQRPGAGAA